MKMEGLFGLYGKAASPDVVMEDFRLIRINCLNNKGTWPYLAEIPKDVDDPHSVSKAVYTAINPDVAKRRATPVTTMFCRKPHG